MSRRDSLTSLPYKIIQRRWFVIVPVVVVMSLVFSYTRSVDLYRSSAIVTFQTEYVLADRDTTLRNLFEEKVSTVVGSLKFGDALRSIVARVWPHIDPTENPVEFNRKVSALGSRNGLDLTFRRDNSRALSIAYTAKDPDEAYRVVQATVDTLIEQTKSQTERRVANSEIFLDKEIKNYREQLANIDKEISRLENGLAPFGLTDSKGDTANEGIALDSRGIREQLKYREAIPQLEFDLKVSEKELARLMNKLETGAYLTEAAELESVLSVGDDYLLNELRSSIAQKEKERHILASQGFLERHPKRKAVEAEIRNLKKLERERVQELSQEAGEQGSELARLKLERDLRSKISQKTEEITQLRDRIAVLKRYQQEVRENKESIVSQIDIISQQRSKLEQLKHQKYVTAEAYQNAVSELELIRRQGRADEGDIGLRIDIAEPATIPKYPLPLAHMSTVVMGLAFSIGLGIGLVCLIDVLDSSVGTVHELREVVQIPVIGEIDRMVTPVARARERGLRIAMMVFLALVVLTSDIIVDTFFL